MPLPTPHAFRLAPAGKALLRARSLYSRAQGSPTLRDALLSGVKAWFDAPARRIRPLGEKAAARLSPADHPGRTVEQMERLLPLPERGTLLHFEAGDGGFLEAFHAARPRRELSVIESGGAFMRLLKKHFLHPAYNADDRDADIAARFGLIAVTKPLNEAGKPPNAARWLTRRLADNGMLLLWQPAPPVRARVRRSAASRSPSPASRPLARPRACPWARSRRKATTPASARNAALS